MDTDGSLAAFVFCSVSPYCKVGSPYTGVTSAFLIDFIQVHSGKESAFIAQQRGKDIFERTIEIF
jgi:hypothetical protein